MRGIGSVWSSASQDCSHVGHAGVGVVSLKGAPLSLPLLLLLGFARTLHWIERFDAFYLWCL